VGVALTDGVAVAVGDAVGVGEPCPEWSAQNPKLVGLAAVTVLFQDSPRAVFSFIPPVMIAFHDEVTMP